MSDSVHDDVPDAGTDAEVDAVDEGGSEPLESGEVESVEELKARLAAAEAREAAVRKESIERRHANKSLKHERDDLTARLEALERKAAEAEVKAAVASAKAAYGLPDEALELLTGTPEEIEKRATVLSKVIGAGKKPGGDGAAKAPRVPSRKPSGGRQPSDPAGGQDVAALIDAYSRR